MTFIRKQPIATRFVPRQWVFSGHILVVPGCAVSVKQRRFSVQPSA